MKKELHSPKIKFFDTLDFSQLHESNPRAKERWWQSLLN